MAKSSFAEAERQGKTLSSILNEEAEDPKVELAEEPQEEIQESTQEVEQQGTESRPVSPLVQRLRDSGFDISDDVEEEDLYGSLVDRIRSQDEIRKQIEQERQEREKLAKDLEEARKQLESRQEPQQPQVPEVPAEAKKDNPWGPVEEVDRESLRFIEQDPETGLYRSRSEYKDVGGKEIADRANKYAMEMKRRSNALLQDPVNAVWGGMADKVSQLIQERAEKIVEERLKAYDSTAKSGLAAAFEKKQQSVIKAERIDGFWEQRARDFLKIDSAGNVMLDLDGNPVKTEVGRVFYDELRYIREELGVKDEEKALNTAWRNVSRSIPKVEPPKIETPVVQQEVVPEKVEPTREEKKKKFVERRIKTDPSVPAGDAVYREPEKETPRFTGRISLADLVKESDE